MKIGELKKAIEVLDEAIKLHGDDVRGQTLLNLLKESNNEEKKELGMEEQVFPPLKRKINIVIGEFWHWVVTNLPPEQWESAPQVEPWLKFQKTLLEAGFDDAEHAQYYQKFAAKFSANSTVDLSKVMSLLKGCARRLGYTEEKNLDQYPLDKLATAIQARKHISHEKETQQGIVLMLGLLFTVLNRYCTAEQLELFPLLCQYRPFTTQEEVRSEQAILRCFTEQVIFAGNFFANHRDYIDAREWCHNEYIVDLAPLLPKTRTEFIKNLCELPWDKILMKQYPGDNEKKAAIIAAAERLHVDFAKLEDHSYLAALQLGSHIKNQIASLHDEGKNFILGVLYIFCLKVYVDDRKNDPRPNHFFSFSGKTKCKAALKKIQSLTDETDFNWVEYFALQQGRLSQIVTSFEEVEKKISLNN